MSNFHFPHLQSAYFGLFFADHSLGPGLPKQPDLYGMLEGGINLALRGFYFNT
jgi:hypothetical protein